MIRITLYMRNSYVTMIRITLCIHSACVTMIRITLYMRNAYVTMLRINLCIRNAHVTMIRITLYIRNYNTYHFMRIQSAQVQNVQMNFTQKKVLDMANYLSNRKKESR